MLLDRIDIDSHGPLNRVELGPFSEYLNVICTPEGSGKTAIARFVRDSLIRREYPLGMMSSSAGRVVWADRNGKIHCRREHDGTASGRRTIEFESRGDASHRFDWLHGSWIDGIADSTDATRALETIRIPESIVDGIVTDTAVTSVSRVIQACLASGLNDPAVFAGLPINRSSVSGTSPAGTIGDADARRSIRDELARVESELATLENPELATDSGLYTASFYDHSYHGLSGRHNRHASIQTRRNELLSRLASLRGTQSDYTSSLHSQHGSSGELALLHDRIWQLRVRHSELSRWLNNLKSDRSRSRYAASIPSTDGARATHLGPSSARAASHQSLLQFDQELRQKLLDADAQIIRWRRVLAEIIGLRETLASDAYLLSVGQLAGHGASPLSEQVLRRERMNHFFASLDHHLSHRADPLSSVTNWETFSARSPQNRWPDEIDLRIEAIVGQIDSLVSHYGHESQQNWYRDLSIGGYRGGVSLEHSLRAIRDDLQNVRRHGFRFESPLPRPADHAAASRNDIQRYDLRRSEEWIVATIERLLAYREGLVHDQKLAELVRYPSWMEESYHHQNWSAWFIEHINGEAVQRSRELDHIAIQLDRCVARALQLRQQTPPLGSLDTSIHASPDAVRSEIDWILAELRSIEHDSAATMSGSSRLEWLRSRRAELIEKLGVPQHRPSSGVPLADEASQWLVRLSGGRLHRVDWNSADFTTAPKQIAAASQTGFAKIDGRDEAACPAVDRALATLAVRFAAGDLLARTGRPIPLLIEAHRELLRPLSEVAGPAKSIPTGSLGRDIAPMNLAVIAAFDDYAKSGRQLIVLASDERFAQQVERRGGKVYTIHGQREASEHRPLWRPHFAAEHYVGPHAGAHLPATGTDPLSRTDAFVDRYYDQYFDSIPAGATLADINRNLDAIWQEAYGLSPAAQLRPSAPAHTPISGVHDSPSSIVSPNSVVPPSSTNAGNWHDGYYFADTYTTAPSSDQHRVEDLASSRSHSNADGLADSKSAGGTRPRSPFFLTVDSPIDQAPSVDAVAASRLRGLDVTHVNHLMNQDPNRLADSVGLSGVTAATIRRWQSECRLVCHVPQLRGFDARVLVGCGITDAGLLSSTDPGDLLDRVEAFLATERGQRILLSGTSYELSRITSWIAAANVNTDDNPVIRIRNHETLDGRISRKGGDVKRVDSRSDNDRYDYEFVDDNGDIVRARSNRQRSGRRSANRTNRRNGTRSAGSHPNPSGSVRDSKRAPHNGKIQEAGYREGRTRYRRSDRRSSQGPTGRTRRTEHDHDNAPNLSQLHENVDDELRFYLQRDSQVVDAPSIGARMAERLENVGIITVDDLLNSDAATLAELLDHRRIDADVITAWQNQAILVCRIPMLRGHDAQLLVAAEITTPEEVAGYDPQDLFEIIDPIAKSNEGKRILRGGNLPDVEEITQWIRCAGHHRELIAA